MINFKSIKHKALRVKRIFTAHWLVFVVNHPRYDTDYYHAEIKKMLVCGSEANGFATYQCLQCGKGEHKVNLAAKQSYRVLLSPLTYFRVGKACPQCGKRYARDGMNKIAAKLFPGVSYRQVVLTLPE